MFETPFDQEESITREEALKILGLGEIVTPNEIIEAYIECIMPFRDQILNNKHSEELNKIKQSYKFLENYYSADVQSSMNQTRQIEEDLLLSQIRTSTNELSGSIKSGVDELWNMFK